MYTCIHIHIPKDKFLEFLFKQVIIFVHKQFPQMSSKASVCVCRNPSCLQASCTKQTIRLDLSCLIGQLPKTIKSILSSRSTSYYNPRGLPQLYRPSVTTSLCLFYTNDVEAAKKSGEIKLCYKNTHLETMVDIFYGTLG